jgi:hypothetical protein
MALALDSFGSILYLESEAAKFVDPRGILRNV